MIKFLIDSQLMQRNRLALGGNVFTRGIWEASSTESTAWMTWGVGGHDDNQVVGPGRDGLPNGSYAAS